MNFIPPKPKPPLLRLIYEWDAPLPDNNKGNPKIYCHKCGSSRKRKFPFIRLMGCIHPKCSNYWQGEKK